MMKRPPAKLIGRPANAARIPRPPTTYMADGGQVGKASRMAGNAKSGTCGPGMAGNRDYKK